MVQGNYAASHKSAPAMLEKTEFTNTRRGLYLGLFVVLIVSAIIFYVMSTGESGFVKMILLGLGLLVGMMTVYTHRKANNDVFMTLTRTQLMVKNLSAPVDLVNVIALSVKDEGLATNIILTFADDVLLPTAKRIKGIFASQAIVLKKRTKPQIMIASAGIKVNGKQLDQEEIFDLFHGYLEGAPAAMQEQVSIVRM